MNTKTTHWGIVGLGLQAGRLARAIRNAEGNTLVSVFGTDAKHANEFAAEFGASNKVSLNSLLSDPTLDAVCISSPNHLHAAQAIAAAKAKKNILCEKPLALNTRDGKAIAREAKKNKVRLSVNFQLRTHPAVVKARSLVSQKQIGELVYVEMQWSIGSFDGKSLPPLPDYMRWRESPKQSGGGALMARSVHLFDLLRFITGKEVSEVRAFSDATSSSVDRTSLATLILEKQIPASMLASKIIADADNKVEIYGTRGHITLRNFFDGKQTSTLRLKTSSGEETLEFEPVDLLANVFRAFTTKDYKQLANGDDGLRAITITEACIASAKTKRAVAVRKYV